MRILPAALIGGTLFWIWGAIAHMLLPIGEMGMKTAVEQDAAIAALQASATSGEGVYMIPGMDPESWRDKPAHEAFVARYKDAPTRWWCTSPPATRRWPTWCPTWSSTG
jgi:hypothetical protein